MRSAVLIITGLVLGLLIMFVVRGNYTEVENTETAKRLDLFSAELSLIDKMSVNHVNFDRYHQYRQASFLRNFNPSQRSEIVKGADKDTLQQLRSEVFDYLLYENDLSALSFLENIYSRLEDEGEVEESQLHSLHKLYLTHRLFDKAAKYRQRHAGLNITPPPEIKNWVVSDNAAVGGRRYTIKTVLGAEHLELSQIDFGSWTGVVVVGHPQCHFFNNFLSEVGADADMGKAFFENTLWLAGTWTSLTDGEVIKWNQSMPKVQFRYAVNETDWPEINYWGSPSFYFFADSRLVKKVVGWPRNSAEQRKAELLAGFQAIGISVYALPKTAK